MTSAELVYHRYRCTAVGCAIQNAREDLGLSLYELARISKICRNTLQRIEAFGIDPASKYFAPLCDLLGLEAKSFFFGRFSCGAWMTEQRGKNRRAGQKRAASLAGETTRKKEKSEEIS